MRSPIIWFGGKGLLTSRLVGLIPPHTTYVEAFGGAASLLFAKDPSPVEVYNDINEDLVNFFRVLRDADKFKRFQRLVELTPYSRREWEHSAELISSATDLDDVNRAHRFFIKVRQSFSGSGKAWAYSVCTSVGGMSSNTKKLLSAISLLPEVHARMMTVQVECRPAVEIINAFDTPDTLFYLDPPYVHGTRVVKDAYEHEMSDSDHIELIDAILGVKGKVMLSGYSNPIYNEALSHWNRCEVSIKAVAGLVKKESGEVRPDRVEVIWMNYSIEDATQPGLFDTNLYNSNLYKEEHDEAQY